jgi:hypothetical protein
VVQAGNNSREHVTVSSKELYRIVNKGKRGYRTGDGNGRGVSVVGSGARISNKMKNAVQTEQKQRKRQKM